jgi:hypothetical protein
MSATATLEDLLRIVHKVLLDLHQLTFASVHVGFFNPFHVLATRLADNSQQYISIAMLESDEIRGFFGNGMERKGAFGALHHHRNVRSRRPWMTIATEDDSARRQRFDILFMYAIQSDDIKNAFREYHDAPGQGLSLFDAALFAINLAVHEIRHELQIYHGLPRDGYLTEFPDQSVYARRKDQSWVQSMRTFHSELIASYRGNVSRRRLEEERDAVILSHYAAMAWVRHARLSYGRRLCKVAQILRATRAETEELIRVCGR